MKFNISNSPTGQEKTLEVDDERKVRNFYDRKIGDNIDGHHLGEEYNGYVFNFKSDGTITITENSNIITGTWSLTGSGNNIDFIINIPSLPDFNGTWNLHEIEQESGETEIEFEKGNDDELSFKSNC